MKINILYLILLLSNLLQAQTITTSWSKMAFDATMVKHFPTNYILVGEEQAVVPLELLSDKESNIYVLNGSESGWQVEKLSVSTGKSLWQTSRNYTTPVLDSNQYFVSDFFMNDDNTVEVLGTRLAVKYPNWGWIVGAAAKAVYDTKTGEEKEYYTRDNRAGTGMIWNRGCKNRFLKKKDGYFIMDPLPFYDYYGTLRRINNNLTKFDTLATLEGDAKSKKALQQAGIQPHFINNSIYYTAGMLKKPNYFDSTQFYYRWFKLDTMGNVLKQKDLNKEFYGVFAWRENKQISDGLLWAGLTDTTYSGTKNQDYHYYITKADTNMNVRWRTFLPQQESRINLDFQLIELKDQKGYLVFQGNREFSDAQTFLYHVGLQGKATYLGKVKLDNTSLNFFPSCAIQLDNKDIAFGFGLLRCWTDINNKTIAVPCGGTALIGYNKIEKLVTSLDVSTENSTDSYMVYPNPSADFINLQLQHPDSGTLTLFDTQGETIKTQLQTTLSSNWQLPITEVSTGIYFLQIKRSNGEIRTEKVVVAR